MVKAECESKNEKVKPYSKELNYYLDILDKFTSWIEDKLKLKKMMLVQQLMITLKL